MGLRLNMFCRGVKEASVDMFNIGLKGAKIGRV